MLQNEKDRYEVRNMTIALGDRKDRKRLKRMRNDGWEVLYEDHSTFSRESDLTLRRPNPGYRHGL